MCSSSRTCSTSAHVRIPSCRSQGGKAGEQPHRSCRRWPRLDPRTHSSEIIAAPTISPLGIGFSLSSGQGGEGRSHNMLPSIAPTVTYFPFRSATNYFGHRPIRAMPPLSSPPLPRGRPYGRCAFVITLAHHMRHSCRWLVPTRGEIGRGSHIGAPT
jgi:hypothetical protein